MFVCRAMSARLGANMQRWFAMFAVTVSLSACPTTDGDATDTDVTDTDVTDDTDVT